MKNIRPQLNPYAQTGNTPDTGRLTEETLSIRLAGIDAPEIAKAGAPGQVGEKGNAYTYRDVMCMLDSSVVTACMC
jgi:hypothetical protein